MNGHESAEAEDAKENGDSAQDTNGDEADHHVNGKNGEAEADCKPLFFFTTKFALFNIVCRYTNKSNLI